MKKIIFCVLCCTTLFGDCVYYLKDKTSFRVIDSSSLILSGVGGDVFIKTYCFVSSVSSVTVLKGDACSYDNNVLLIDGQVCDVAEVKKL